jgi:hypothetical protein
VKVLFRLPDLSGFDYFITWRGGSRLWLPDKAPELALLKPELRFEVQEALALGDTCLERLTAVSPRYWRELYALARFVYYDDPPEPPAVMWYADQDLAVIAARRLALSGRRVLLEVPELSSLHAALLAGCEVTVCVAVSSRGLEAADALTRQPRASARSMLRSINLLGGAWDERTAPQLAENDLNIAEFDAYAEEAAEALAKLEPPAAPGSLPEPRELDPLLDLAFGADADAAFALLRDVATGPLPLRSVPELGQYAPLLRDLIAYGYATVERDVVRITEKGLYALLQKMGGAGGGGRVEEAEGAFA